MMKNLLRYPFDPHVLLKKKRVIRRSLLEGKMRMTKRIAILGGSTTAEIRDMLELFLLYHGIRPEFYESAYNRYYEDAMFGSPELQKFRPDLIYVFTSSVNLSRSPAPGDSEETVRNLVAAEFSRFDGLWDSIASAYSCPIIQNNFELPHYRVHGNFDSWDMRGRTHFTLELNRRFAEAARERKNLYLHDLNYLSAWYGLERWHDRAFWYSYKYAMNYGAIPFVAHSVASMIRAIYGGSKKCLMLDLDNTLWGGVIADDGVGGIRLGKETPEGEAYTEFQQYIKELGARGVILAVCSKNDDDVARSGFSHPDSVLKIEDFASFKANWQPKNENVLNILRAINIGEDAVVFLDDNPVEREIVQSQVPDVEAPDIGEDVARYIHVLGKGGYFEIVALSKDDLERNSFYKSDTVRREAAGQFQSYEAFLQSLEMTAEIEPFGEIYLDRIAQLTNKTNQFNLTTKRYTRAELAKIAEDRNYLTLYGRLADRFGDSGIVSVIVGRLSGEDLHIELWLMSCRVLKRGMEMAMLDRLVEMASGRGVKKLHGYYFRTAKNNLVSKLYEELGFTKINENDDNCRWALDIAGQYENRNNLIKVCQ